MRRTKCATEANSGGKTAELRWNAHTGCAVGKNTSDFGKVQNFHAISGNATFIAFPRRYSVSHFIDWNHVARSFDAHSCIREKIP
jgi:hypothetical protein